MCGVIGYKPFQQNDLQTKMFERLFDESRIRGHHAYGIANQFITERSFSPSDVLKKFDPNLSTIGHTRYCQSGDWRVMENNQPLVVKDIKLDMNGVIHMGTKEEFEKAFNVVCEVDNDSEIFLQRLHGGQDADEFILTIKGSFAATLLVAGELFAGRNARRPLWKCLQHDALWYASTRDIFLRAGFHDPVEIPVGVEL